MSEARLRDILNRCSAWLPEDHSLQAEIAAALNGTPSPRSLPSAVAETEAPDLDHHAIRRAAEFLDSEALALCIHLGKPIPASLEPDLRPMCDQETQLMNVREYARRLRRMLPENVEARENARAEAMQWLRDFLKVWRQVHGDENVIVITGAATCLYANDLDAVTATQDPK